jgi:ATP-dependent DNA helicase RecG
MKAKKVLTWSSSLLDLTSRPTKSIQTLYDAGVTTLWNLLWILPKNTAPIKKEIDAFLNHQDILQVDGFISHLSSQPVWAKKKKMRFFKIRARFQVGLHSIQLFWPYAYSNTLNKLTEFYKNQEELTIRGEVNLERFFAMFNPHIISKSAQLEDETYIEYPQVHNIKPSYIAGIIQKIPKHLWDNIPDGIPEHIILKRNLVPLKASFQKIHAQGEQDLSLEKAIDRLKYQEFYQEQVMLKLDKTQNAVKNTNQFKTQIEDLIEYRKLLPFQLRQEQEKVLQDILQDFKAPYCETRLVQGDVGTGKTVIAFLTALVFHKRNQQSAFMAPTENLIVQHYENFIKLFPKLKEDCVLITSSIKNPIDVEKISTQDNLIVFGTHSLIQDSIIFKNLRFITIDEQHRFGVKQRNVLFCKGHHPYVLLLTATPIPRTLKLTTYHKLKFSSLKNKSNEKPIGTRIITPANFSQYLSFLKTRLELKEQVYVVVPAIEENEAFNINFIDNIFKQYQNWFPEKSIAFLHGKLKNEDKINILDRFRKHQIDILISTTVIEVGIDIHNATVMSIYNPERFGLSSLHQLRGRVGRGHRPGFCFLQTDGQTSQIQVERLKLFEKCQDGFELSEIDLKNRGYGDLLGAEQSGNIARYKLSSTDDVEILEQVIEDTKDLSLDELQEINTVYFQKNKEFFEKPI